MRPASVMRLASAMRLAVPAVLLCFGTATGAEPRFVDIAASSGVDFVHSNGATGDKQYQEVMGSGAALLDYDGDGFLDVYLVTSAGPNRLYRNLGDMKFADVTDQSGAGDLGYGMGAVSVDVEGDGDPDLFVTNFGANAFYRNRGNGTFEEVAEELGLDDPRWGAGAAFLDYDHDGRLDVYVTNYVQVAVPDTNVCGGDVGRRLYCSPRAYPREADVLFRQLPDGTFMDVSAATGVGAFVGRSLGTIVADFDGDRWPDIYVANDLDRNFLFRNTGKGTFEEMGLMAGVSHSEDGMEESGMGLAVADCNGDGRVDVFVSNYQNETNTLYENEGDGFFFDESATSALGPISLPWIGWGAGFLDYDRDGWLDLLMVNGHTESDAALVDRTTSWEQPGLLFRNLGDARFEEVSEQVAPALTERRSARGAAFGDLDNDGDIDVVIVNQNAPVRLLECRGLEGEPTWIGLDLRGTPPNRDAVGALVELWSENRRRVAEVRAGDSYLSSSDRRILFALPGASGPDSVVVHWPAGGADVMARPERGRYHRVQQGRTP